MRSTDILVTVHGAGETNMAWMKPCSVVLEVFPWAFYYDYFGSLAGKIMQHNDMKCSTILDMFDFLRMSSMVMCFVSLYGLFLPVLLQ